MSRAISAAPVRPLSRPTLVDYLLLLVGAGLSLYLIDLNPLQLDPSDAVTNPTLRAGVAFLPRLLRLPEGIILVLPFFLVAQWPLGRREGLTTGEWLWLLSWCGTAFLTGLTVAVHFGLLPEIVRANLLLIQFIWYIGFELAMAGLALVLAIIGLFRSPRPWTHQLGLALALWPVAPLAGILTLTKLFL